MPEEFEKLKVLEGLVVYSKEQLPYQAAKDLGQPLY
jgi:hypothetical protein